MDKDQIIGLVLLALLFIVWYAFFLPESQPVPQTPAPIEERAPDTTTSIEQPSPADTLTASEDSVANLQNQQKFGIFADAAQGEARQVTLENELIKVTFNSKGGEIERVELRTFKTAAKEPLVLLDEESSAFSYIVNIDNRQIDIMDLYFSPSAHNQSVAEDDTIQLAFTLDLGQGRTIVKSYELAGDSYQIRSNLSLTGFEGMIAGNSIAFRWKDRIKLLERDIEESRLKTTINYYTSTEDFEDLGENSLDLEEETVSEPIKWAAVKQKFFTSGIIADNHFAEGYFKTNVDEGDTTTVKNAELLLQIPLAENGNSNAAFTYYFGPNNYNILKKVAPGFNKNIYLGWPPVSLVNKFLIIPIFQFLERFIGNYGVIIFLLVIIIRIIISPLTYKSYVSMAKTKVLKPELDLIKEKYKDDMQKAQSEQMQLYQKAGVNPLSGCIPMLLQMPILFAMFYFFPNSIELRQESFLWADDLSTYDAIITWDANIPLISSFFGNHLSLFTLLMTLSTILYTWSNNQMTSVQGPMKNIGYIMPVVFMFVLNKFSAALTYYYFLSNLVSFGQQAIIKRFIDEDKIKRIMDENKLRFKSGKKSKFQARLEEAMKARQDDGAKGKPASGSRNVRRKGR